MAENEEDFEERVDFVYKEMDKNSSGVTYMLFLRCVSRHQPLSQRRHCTCMIRTPVYDSDARVGVLAGGKSRLRKLETVVSPMTYYSLLGPRLGTTHQKEH